MKIEWFWGWRWHKTAKGFGLGIDFDVYTDSFDNFAATIKIGPLYFGFELYNTRVAVGKGTSKGTSR